MALWQRLRIPRHSSGFYPSRFPPCYAFQSLHCLCSASYARPHVEPTADVPERARLQLPPIYKPGHVADLDLPLCNSRWPACARSIIDIQLKLSHI
ncbi:hypothetical protein DENSPDRAFT_342448 [Dentipellis sp. KUC8613]|nr:hypothetical protein DENSPDRAFT_342448 [Dentipellis sp. KUC8613]